MYGNVDDMVSAYRKAVYLVVERKGEIANIAFHQMAVKLKPLRIRRACEIMEVFYNGIIDEILIFIYLKRSIEGVGIDYDNEKDYTGDMNKRT